MDYELISTDDFFQTILPHDIGLAAVDNFNMDIGHFFKNSPFLLNINQEHCRATGNLISISNIAKIFVYKTDTVFKTGIFAPKEKVEHMQVQSDIWIRFDGSPYQIEIRGKNKNHSVLPPSAVITCYKKIRVTTFDFKLTTFG
jgi:hypothetical protein